MRVRQRRWRWTAAAKSPEKEDLDTVSAVGTGTHHGLTVTEVYTLLKEAPSTQHALQLAARLRRAAREGKKTKEGRTLEADVIDDALDILLDTASQSRMASVSQGTEGIGAKSNTREQEEDQEDEEEMSHEEEDMMLATSDAEEPVRYKLKAEKVNEMKKVKDDDDDDSEDGSDPYEDSLKATTKWGMKEDEPGAVPAELWEQVISRKFNVVDRVWRAPTAAALPKVPSSGDDPMISESAWLRLPHVAVNGMTNCGKSTLINHILRWTYAAKASSVPGRTKSIDFYCINNRFVLVDLPGYPDPEELAHQAVLRKWEAHWQDLVLTYLQMCADGQYDLRLMLQLQATKNRPSRVCRRFVQELKKKDLPLLLILTKDDQLKKPNEERNYYATQIKKTLGLDGQHLHFTAKGMLRMSRRSKYHLQRWIRTAVAAKDAKEVKQLLQEKWQNRRICETLKTPEEMQAKKERWKAHYKTLREERKKQKAEERQNMAKAQTHAPKEAPKLRIRIPRNAEADA